MLQDGKQLRNGSVPNSKLVTPAAFPTKDDKAIVCLATAADHDPATASGITHTPASGSMVTVLVNGAQQVLGDGVKTKDCYFSADGGVTAKAIASIVATDVLYWNGSIAGFQLATTDTLSYNYDV